MAARRGPARPAKDKTAGRAPQRSRLPALAGAAAEQEQHRAEHRMQDASLGRANKILRATGLARSRPWPRMQVERANGRTARQAACQRWPRPTRWRGECYRVGGATGVLPPTGGYGLGRCPARSTAVVSGLGRDHPGLGHHSANAGSWNCKNVWAAAAASSSRASQSPMMARPAAMKMSASDSPSPPPSVPRAG